MQNNDFFDRARLDWHYKETIKRIEKYSGDTYSPHEKRWISLLYKYAVGDTTEAEEYELRSTADVIEQSEFFQHWNAHSAVVDKIEDLEKRRSKLQEKLFVEYFDLCTFGFSIIPKSLVKMIAYFIARICVLQ